MISRVQSGAVLGIDGTSVEVEVNLAMGIPGMSIVGSINPFTTKTGRKIFVV